MDLRDYDDRDGKKKISIVFSHEEWERVKRAVDAVLGPEIYSTNNSLRRDIEDFNRATKKL